MSVINFEFRNEVLKHNASLSYCYQCSTCTGGCPIALLTRGSYNPRKIIEEAILGLEGKLVEKQEPNPWLCSTCQKCVELCPQKVELTEIFILIKNRCFETSKVPEPFILQGQAVMENGVAIPYSKAIETRRTKLGLPMIKTAPVDEIKAIITATDFERNIGKVGVREISTSAPSKAAPAKPSEPAEAKGSIADILYRFQPELKKKRGI